MEIGFNVHKLQAAAYKIVKWEGDVKQAESILGKDANIEFYSSPQSFLKGVADWSLSSYQRVLSANGIEKDMPFVKVITYVPFYVPLNKELYFVHGQFPAYHGGYETRWSVLTPDEMTGYLTPEGASEYIINILGHGN